ncbi:MAG TPA: MarR family EPS-associated transcriptional regulator [Caldimonas sp.]|nr:MarR family EPS-associated transcriptional regulator [Caldimonas sp.]
MPERSPHERVDPGRLGNGHAAHGDTAEHARELELLRLLEQHPDYSQRQMSSALGVSLGKAHYLLKALLDKGWVKARNFKHSAHKARYLYVLTPNGVRQRMQLTRSFLARKEREYDELHAQIATLRRELAREAGEKR